MHCDLSSEEAKIPAKISNLKVFNPYGRLGARLEGGQLSLAFFSLIVMPWRIGSPWAPAGPCLPSLKKKSINDPFSLTFVRLSVRRMD